MWKTIMSILSPHVSVRSRGVIWFASLQLRSQRLQQWATSKCAAELGEALAPLEAPKNIYQPLRGWWRP